MYVCTTAMAHAGFSSYSPDSSLLAVCAEDGKLKIYDTLTSTLKQEYIPNFHLASSCSAIAWFKVSAQANHTSVAPRKKRKRKSSVSVSEDVEQKSIVALGSVNGTITLYDVSSASVSSQLQDGHSSTVTALSWSPSAGLFTAAEDKQIVQWNLQDNSVKSKWKQKSRGKITAIAVLPTGNSLLTASKVISWWDLSTKQEILKFTNQADQISSLNILKIDEDTSCLISSAVNDTTLSVWSLNEETKEKNNVGTLTMLAEPLAVSVQSYKDDQIMVLTTTRDGVSHLFKYPVNEVTPKPIKPSLTVKVVSDSKKESVQLIPILTSALTIDSKMMLAYGSLFNIHFEKVNPDFSNECQVLVRSDMKKSKERKEEAVLKMKAADTENNVEYLVAGAGSGTKRNRSSTGAQLPLKDRLENLSLEDRAISEKVQSKGESMVHLLIQGLQSKERTILENVLYNKNENVISSTVSKLPVQALVPLLKELTTMLQGKTFPSKIASMWLKAVIKTHAGQLMAHPDAVEALSPILSFIDTKVKLMTEISKLRGRVNLITGQIFNAQEKQNNEEEVALLVYQDSGSSDEEELDMDETDMGEVESESDDHWESDESQLSSDNGV